METSDSKLVAANSGLAPLAVWILLPIFGLCSIPAVTGLVTRFLKRDPKQLSYEDEDGKATLESTKAYSARLPKSLIVLAAFTGCAASIALAVLSRPSERHWPENILSIGAWSALVFQAVVIASSRSSIRAYSLGTRTFFSSGLLAAVLFFQGSKDAEFILHRSHLLFGLRAAELALAVSLALASLTLPRRPDVFYHGELVDRLYTVSAFSRFTYSWPAPLLSLAARKKDLDMADLHRPGHRNRSSFLSSDWKRRNYRHRLWLSLVLAHKGAIALQWALTLCTAFLNFTPQWVILQILRLLETPQLGKIYGFGIWSWVVFLGVSIIAQSWVESYVYWLSFAELNIPIRAQLSALIFEKAMSKKDVKGAGKSKKTPQSSAEPVVTGPAGESTASDRPEADEEEEYQDPKKSKQSTVNLIGVDAKRIADFSSYQNMFPGSMFKLIVSLSFLTSLLGWKALLAGFSAMLAITPVNIHFSKKYSAAQDQLMKLRDEKMEVVTEALQGIRQIKFSALEPEWEKKILGVRERELGAVWDVFMFDTALIACWLTSPIALSAISLAVYAYINNTLTPSIAFVSLSVFKALEVTLSVIPELTTDLLDAWVSLKRIQDYLDSPEVSTTSKPSHEVSFKNASIAWPSDESLGEEDRFILRNVNVTFPQGELSVISGKTGTGKSLMLSAILGEVDVLEGTLHVPRAPSLSERHDDKANKSNWIIPEAIAYVAQIPWLENATIRDNIVFGLPFDEERWNTTVEVCALKKDLEMLSDGENTEIGAQGINLSGGQKWRVTLARAVYSRAGILVLDDIFSAVDAHVGRHIFEKCLQNGPLAAGRTRILVTHHVALCEPKTKYLVELGDGGVLNAGLLSELRDEGTLQKIKSHEQNTDEIEAEDPEAAVNSDASTVEYDGQGANDNRNSAPKPPQTGARKFVEEEAREKGSVRKHIYLSYLHASGGWTFWLLVLLIFALVQVFAIGRSWWLKTWTGNYEEHESSHHHVLNASRDHGYAYATGVQQTSVHVLSAPSIKVEKSLTFYLGVYVALAVISSIVGTFRFVWIYFGSVRASRALFTKLNFTVLRTPLRWLDTVPLGRILNRFTADFNIIDSQLANSMSFGFSSFLSVFGIVVAGLFVSPYIVLLATFLLVICLHYAIRYLNAARPVKRLESTTKSPVFEQFGSALSGVATIRGFDKAQVYIERMYRKLDDYSMATWHLWLFNRWMGWRMALVGSFFATFVSILILLAPGISSSLAGFALAFALEFSGAVVWTIRLYANLELNMNAAERIIEYTEIPTESLDGQSPPAAWPTEGRIEVEDLVVGYADDLPPVLNGLTFSVNRNERIGVVGRTGAGKSSLTLALFRFLEARSGSIHIDGLDISKIKLHDLRSRLAIIPQDPVLFSGSIRSNLDPFGHHTDEELRDCLQRVHLTSSSLGTSGVATPTEAGPSSVSSTPTASPKNANIFEHLDSAISEGGLNLSQGQRQLLCLARAIVSRPKILVLDEATSAVDMHTDALIQRSIREEFTDATLLVIAHRLSTIADFDRILVLSDGRVAEFGTPRELWGEDEAAEAPIIGDKPQKGMFRAMCDESGEKEKLRSIAFGKE